MIVLIEKENDGTKYFIPHLLRYIKMDKEVCRILGAYVADSNGVYRIEKEEGLDAFKLEPVDKSVLIGRPIIYKGVIYILKDIVIDGKKVMLKIKDYKEEPKICPL